MLTYSRFFNQHRNYVDYAYALTPDKKPSVAVCIDSDHTHYNDVLKYTFTSEIPDIYDKDGQVEGRTIRIPEGSTYVFSTNNTNPNVPILYEVKMGGTVIFLGKNNSQCACELISGTGDIITHYRFTVYSVTGDIELYMKN